MRKAQAPSARHKVLGRSKGSLRTSPIQQRSTAGRTSLYEDDVVNSDTEMQNSSMHDMFESPEKKRKRKRTKPPPLAMQVCKSRGSNSPEKKPVMVTRKSRRRSFLSQNNAVREVQTDASNTVIDGDSVLLNDTLPPSALSPRCVVPATGNSLSAADQNKNLDQMDRSIGSTEVLFELNSTGNEAGSPGVDMSMASSTSWRSSLSEFSASAASCPPVPPQGLAETKSNNIKVMDGNNSLASPVLPRPHDAAHPSPTQDPATDKSFAVLTVDDDELFLGEALYAEVYGHTVEAKPPPPFGLQTADYNKYLSAKNIPKLYDWQTAACTAYTASRTRRLVYSVPTSGGKTLVAELALLQTVLVDKKDIIFMLPFVSIVEEKYEDLQHLAELFNFRVELHAGPRGRIPSYHTKRTSSTVYVATYEKAAGLVDYLCEQRQLEDKIGFVVVDELHMLGSGSRGAVLEAVLTKIAYAKDVAFMGITATISNLQEIAAYLDADFFSSEFRPVVVNEMAVIGGNLFRVEHGTIATKAVQEFDLPPSKDAGRASCAETAALVVQINKFLSKEKEYPPCLVFCSTKKECENLATQVVRMIGTYAPTNITTGPNVQGVAIRDKRKKLLEMMAEESGGVDPMLHELIMHGVTYHHAGLSGPERGALQQAYLEGTLHCICCTSTLAAGVNLPAQIVVLAQKWYGRRSPITPSEYRQMAGRAGRAGLCTLGTSVLLLPTEHLRADAQTQLLAATIEPVTSCLLSDNQRVLRRTALSLIAGESTGGAAGISKTDLKAWFGSSLFGRQNHESYWQKVCTTLTHLEKISMIKVEEDWIKPTSFGYATFRSNLDVDNAIHLDTQIVSATAELKLNTDLHLLYLVVPAEFARDYALAPYKRGRLTYADSHAAGKELIFSRYEQRFRTLLAATSEDATADRNLCEALKCGEQYVEMRHGGRGPYVRHGDSIVPRLYLAMCLQTLVSGTFCTLRTASQAFWLPMGTVQDLLRASAVHANCLSIFCKERGGCLAWMHVLFQQLAKRLRYGVPVELVPIMEIKGVRPTIAQALVECGFSSLELIQDANAADMVLKVNERLGGPRLKRRIAQDIIDKAQTKLKLVEQLAEQEAVT